MTPIQKVSLAFACSEKLDRHNFCSKCSNAIYDFRQTEDNGLSKVISDSARSVCGIFKRSQLNITFIKFAATLVAGSLSACSISPESERVQEHLSGETSIASEEWMGIVAEVTPTYKGGYKNLYATVQQNLRYPQECVDGATYISFLVKSDGTITEIEVLKGISKAADAEALRVVSLLTEWTPGEQNGKKVNVRMVLPIRFTTQPD